MRPNLIDEPSNAGWSFEEINQRLAETQLRHGAWTAHNVHLGHGIYPLGCKPTLQDEKLNRVSRIIQDCMRSPWSDARILDLACLEGLYSVEFARRGAEVVAIEGRLANIAKAQLAKDAWRLDKLHLVQDDVRNISLARNGTFNVVLSLGILYHLPAPDLFGFVNQIFEMCSEFAIFDTHISLQPDSTTEWQGQIYDGEHFREHQPNSTEEERLNASWSSLDNETSFWLSRQSLLNLLSRVGFSTVYECLVPFELHKPANRLTLVAHKARE